VKNNGSELLESARVEDIKFCYFEFESNHCIRKTILSDASKLIIILMNMINIIKILYLSKLVLHFELLKIIKIVLNIRNVTGFLQFSGRFYCRFKETAGKIEKRVKYLLT